jgi:putative GTP pyrophosphokinase
LNPLDFGDDLWNSRPQVIRSFVESTPNYGKLAEEISYILENRLDQAGIEFASITFRTKTLDSFCEKVGRKKYKDPLKEITDLAGVRVVYLYTSDLAKITSIIEAEFLIMEKVDKVEEGAPDRFGYGALHYLVKLGKKASGVRYDDLKDLVCEVQVRTILQDAWALVSHHLSYKKEADIPNRLRRKLHALSGLFETADDQFNMLNVERSLYAESVERTLSAGVLDFLSQEINLDNFREYLKWRFPERESEVRQEAAGLLDQLQTKGFKKLADIQRLLDRTEDAIRALEVKYPPMDPKNGDRCPYTQIGAVRVAINIIDENQRNDGNSYSTQQGYDEFMHLVKPNAPEKP